MTTFKTEPERSGSVHAYYVTIQYMLIESGKHVNEIIQLVLEMET